MRPRRFEKINTTASVAERYSKRHLRWLTATTGCHITVAANPESKIPNHPAQVTTLALSGDEPTAAIKAVFLDTQDMSFQDALVNQTGFSEKARIFLRNAAALLHEHVIHTLLAHLKAAPDSIRGLHFVGWGAASYTSEIDSLYAARMICKNFCKHYDIKAAIGNHLRKISRLIDDQGLSTTARPCEITVASDGMCTTQYLRLTGCQDLQLTGFVTGLAELAAFGTIINRTAAGDLEILSFSPQRLEKGQRLSLHLLALLGTAGKDFTLTSDRREAG